MHDPNILAFDWNIKIRKKGPHYEFFPILSIWHVDPELDGSDDSCGWTYPRASKADREKLKSDMEFAKWSVLENWKIWNDENRMSLIYTTYRQIKWYLYREVLTTKDLLWIHSICYNYEDNITIHQEFNNEWAFESFYWNLVRHVKKTRRKWWQHPRWHVHHWKIQVNLFRSISQAMKRKKRPANSHRMH